MGKITHGLASSPEYRVWCAAKDRCYNPRIKSYVRYGARGIVMCEEWRHSFAAFIRDMGRRPTAHHTIERINNDGPYAPENCCWATRRQQGTNKSTNVYLTYDGRTQTLKEWAREIGFDQSVIRARLATGKPMSLVLSKTRLPKPGHERRFLTAFGITRSLTGWARVSGLRVSLIQRRIDERGWPIEKAVSTPAMSNRCPPHHTKSFPVPCQSSGG